MAQGDAYQRLLDFLHRLQPGLVPQDAQDELASLLVECWEEIPGSDEAAMAGYKLSKGRMEQPAWEPPYLSFIIERHGAMLVGSTRAELQAWTLDTEKKVTSHEEYGYRQKIKPNPPLNVIPLADEVAESILNRRQAPRLQWTRNGCVRVLTSGLLGGPLIPKATIEGRRHRFRAALFKIIGPHGWQPVGAYYRPSRERCGSQECQRA